MLRFKQIHNEAHFSMGRMNPGALGSQTQALLSESALLTGDEALQLESLHLTQTTTLIRVW